MSKKTSLLLSLACTVALATQASALSIYVDAAPNIYGSPAYTPWKDAAFAAAANGTFVNMKNSSDPANVGTNGFEITDEVVYSFGDLGKRLTWIYWLAGETKQDLTGRLQVSLVNYWGSDPKYDFYADYYGETWLTPSSLVDYDSDGDGDTDGVIGTAGMAWWGAYNTNTQAALDSDLAAWGSVAERWVFTARLDRTDTTFTSIRDAQTPVPEPGTLVLLGSGLLGVAGYARKRKRV